MKRTIILTMAAAAATFAQDSREKPRVFITDSTSWQMNGRNGGARPQTAEILKTFGESCRAVTVTNNRERADFVVTLDHEGGKGYLLRDNKVAVFNRDGDMIHSGSTRSLGNSVRDACRAITR